MDTWYFNEENDCLRWQSCYKQNSTLIYIHGLGCASSNDYPPVITSSFYRNITSLLVDLPGAGFSDKPAATEYDSGSQSSRLQQWIAETGLKEISLFGHSAGAFIALKLAGKLSPQAKQLILCTPGLNDYGISFLEEITSMTKEAFILYGFSALMEQLKYEGGNDAWLGPFQVCSPDAIWQWANSALSDNTSDWLSVLADLPINKGIILPDTATDNEIKNYTDAGCTVELVANSGHMVAYDNPDGLADAISRLMEVQKG